jgi:hypothetical protein
MLSPRRDTKKLVLSMDADGSGVFVFRRAGVTYKHKHWAPPVNVLINGREWKNLNETPVEWANMARSINLSSAKILSRDGRDSISLELKDDGFDLYVSDSPNGGGSYSVVIEFSDK